MELVNLPVGLPVLVFYGDCGFCTVAARACQRWLKLEQVEPWQMLDLDLLRLTPDRCSDAVQWVDRTDRVSAAEHAIIAAFRSAGRPWSLVAAVVDLPGLRQLAGVTYRLVAKYRHQLPGGTPACKL